MYRHWFPSALGERLVASGHGNGSSREAPSASGSGSGLRTPVAPVAAPVTPPEAIVVATGTLESLLNGLGSGAGGSRSLARNPAWREAGGEASREGVEAAGGHGEATGRVRKSASRVRAVRVMEAARGFREGACRARVPAEVRKSSGEVEEEGKSRDDER